MMANVIVSDNPGLTNAMSKNSSFRPAVANYLRNTHDAFMKKASSLGQSFKDGIVNTFNYFNDEVLIQNTMNNIRMNDGFIGADVIHEINHDDYRRTNFKMRKYIMADPKINRLYKLNRVTGYEGQFNSSEEYLPANERFDHLYVMDGVLQHYKDGDGYFEYVSSSDGNPLTMAEQLSVIDSRDYVNHMINYGEDPTDIIE